MSGHDTSPLHPEADVLLQAALSDPFSVPPDLSRVSPQQLPESSEPAGAGAPASAPVATPSEEAPSSLSSSSVSVSPAEQEAWRAGYEAQVAEWRRQSADVRTRAESERARWEERRARERGEQQAGAGATAGRREVPARADTSTSVSTSEWEAVSQRSESSVLASSSTAASTSANNDSPGPVAGAAHSQAQASHPPSQNQPGTVSSNPLAKRPAPSTSPVPPAVTAATRDPTESPQWENVSSSPTSSFPSMSFPEPSLPHSPEQHPSHAPPATTTAAGNTTPAASHGTAGSVTLAVFDNTLPASTRFWSLVSSLSINMLLPFVNGVMLGFGEIFAKTVIVGWLGWGPKVATNLGLGIPSRNRQR